MPTLQQRLADSSDARVRKEAMRALAEFLRDDLDELAMKKLWRSIFFAMWLADMAPVQDELARRVAKTLHRFSTACAAKRWLAIFADTLAKEWPRLDKYRLDKYYSLARSFRRAGIFRRRRGSRATPRPRRGYFSGGSRRRRGRDVDISPVGRGAATWIFRGDESRRRRDVDIPW